jgi:hypothetical protein
MLLPFPCPQATNGDTFLGGEDFDNTILNHLVGEFKKVRDPIGSVAFGSALDRQCCIWVGIGSAVLQQLRRWQQQQLQQSSCS